MPVAVPVTKFCAPYIVIPIGRSFGVAFQFSFFWHIYAQSSSASATTEIGRRRDFDYRLIDESVVVEREDVADDGQMISVS